ncbi:CDP-archaeol synthase [Pseudohalocynthiibacter sp. F2068]|jgi:hypothetical protein|uniref:CDP-archaeol synthase n=1 Tax=Pseudohalocynthiibacter sp. F2068 TaxID=2926418 RepID=UPI001FF68C7F|nr:CDP-archaeol synthase [Pseudohalocynthiibacter sp. F2068]MCK0101173.1 CDP-archaeol synthase [Pseudohalocynthiibacter sp. F2068]
MTGTDFCRAVFLVLAMAGPGAAHVIWLRSDAARRMGWPVDGGLTLRGRRIFGANKRLAGFVVLPPAAGLSFWILAGLWAMLPGALPAMIWPLSGLQYCLLGLACGFAFLLAELPNSFVKRQFDVAPGAAPRASVFRVFSTVLDRFDSVIGCLIVAGLFVPVSLATWAWVLALGTGQHALFSFAMFRLGLKERAL